MPELPEMENYKILLSTLLIKRVSTDVRVNRPKSVNIAAEQFINQVTGSAITSIGRRAKHLIFRLDSGNCLLLHLMLGGWMYYGTEADRPNRTSQVEIDFEDATLYFFGLRLGYLHLLREEQLNAKLADLGPEPLNGDLTEQRFTERLRGKKGALKPLLVNQQWLAGIGNCYADEICFMAGVRPSRKCSGLTLLEAAALHRAVRSVLPEATRLGGYMENPLYKGDLLTGGYNAHCKVYDRGGQPCLRCGALIELGEIVSRKMFFCPVCQH